MITTKIYGDARRRLADETIPIKISITTLL